MKYSQYSSKSKGSSAFYIIIAACLVLIGVAAWFAFSRMNNDTKPTPKTSENISSYEDEYLGNDSSYNEITSNISSNIISSQIVNEKAESVPYSNPVKSYSLPINGEILKDFNATALQYSATFGDLRVHNAVDIACSDGTPVAACTDGIVQSVEESLSYGKTVVIDHGDGLVIKYAALKDIIVKNGQKVKMGDKLGSVTTVPCESSDQPHLHIETFKNGKSISILSLFD